MASEFLSICIPTYNRARLLREILTTFGAQIREAGFTAADIGFHISDNASPDSTPQVVQEFQSQGLPITYSRNPANAGISKNLLKVIAMGCGRYIWTVGDDEVICPGAVAKVVAALRQHQPGLLIAFNTEYRLPLPKPGVYADYRVFSQECLRVASAHPLAEQTLLSSNILRSDLFDPKFAEENIDTFFPHMFGMLRPMLKQHTPVLLPDFPIITVREEERGVPSDGVWSNLDACWATYLGWLREEMELPELDPHAASRAARKAMFANMRSDPLGYLKKNWRAIFQPSAYKFFFTRLFGLK